MTGQLGKFMKLSFLLMSSLVLLLACGGRAASPKQSVRGIAMTGQNSESYEINGKPVSAEAFGSFLANFKEVPGTWFCAETKDGGETGSDMKDRSGNVYEFRTVSESGRSRNSLRKKNLDD